MFNKTLIACLMAMIVLAASVLGPRSVSAQESNRQFPLVTKGTLPASFGGFTKNMGQWPDTILFRGSFSGTTFWLVQNGIYYDLRCSARKPTAIEATEERLASLGRGSTSKRKEDRHQQLSFVKAEFVNSSPLVRVEGRQLSGYKCNYFLSNIPSHWRTDVPNYDEIVFREIYPGVNAVLRNNTGFLEVMYEGSDSALEKVRVHYPEATLDLQPNEGIVIETIRGKVIFDGLLPKYEIGGTHTSTLAAPIETSASLSLVYSTWLGGSGGADWAEGIVVDGSGYAYVTGVTQTANFPLVTPADNTYGGHEVFVSKLSLTGDSLIYSTFLGGSDNEGTSGGIAIDASSCIYLTGVTYSTDFPTFNDYQSDPADNNYDAFLTKLSATGSTILYSTYLGGSDHDQGNDVTVDAAGSAYVVGETWSTDFPTVSPIRTDQTTVDAFVTKFSPAGTSLIFSTYLGGNGPDYAYGAALGQLGNVFVVGLTTSTDFPIKNQFQSYQGNQDAFVAKLGSGGDSLIYSTYLGGIVGHDVAQAVAVDTFGCAYIAGYTESSSFPTLNPFQNNQSGRDGFVSKLNAVGNSLVYSTYLGGADDDVIFDIAIDKNRHAFVTGYTDSPDFPISQPFQLDSAGRDAFVTRLSLTGNSPVFSSYLRGNQNDEGRAIAVDVTGYTYVAGRTSSSDFPLVSPLGGGNPSGDDAFVSKFFRLCCQGVTGDLDLNGSVDISDLSKMISYLTLNPRPALACFEEADVNSSGVIDITDLTILSSFLTSGTALPNCP